EFTRKLLPTLRHTPLGLVTLDPIDNDEATIRVNTGIADLAAKELTEKGAIKGTPNPNLAYILAETAIVNTHASVIGLVLDDSVIKTLDQRILHEVVVNRSLAKFHIYNQMDILKVLSM